MSIGEKRGITCHGELGVGGREVGERALQVETMAEQSLTVEKQQLCRAPG